VNGLGTNAVVALLRNEARAGLAFIAWGVLTETAIALHLSAVAAALAAAYARQMAAKARALARATVRVLKKVAKKIGHAVVAVAKAAYKISGAQDIVSCVTDPSLGSCVQAALTVALTIGTDGLGGIAEHAAADLAENAGEHIAEDAGENALKDAAESCLIGGSSFTPGTKVLLASGAAIPISQLRAGDKVLATNTKTGKTQPETVTAVLVHHDTDLYDLKVRNHGKTAVIDTTSNHLFWVPATRGDSGRWVKAGALRYGTHLRTPSGSDTATVLGGWIPRQSSGWMWDLTVPGNNDHDFYIDTYAAATLVHNCTTAMSSAIGDDALLVKSAEQAGRNETVQREMDNLFTQLSNGNMNPGIGTKALTGTDVSYARGANGARLFFRNVDGGIEVVGKADKGNESRVIARLMQLYG
jgi:hypothetical protein